MSETDNPPSEWARGRQGATGAPRRAARNLFQPPDVGLQRPADREGDGAERGRGPARDQVLADRRLDSQEDYARLQVARLNKALLCADLAVEDGRLEAIPHFVRIVAALDRYHGLSRPAPRERPAEPRLRAPPPAPLALTHASAPLAAPVAGMSAREDATA